MEGWAVVLKAKIVFFIWLRCVQLLHLSIHEWEKVNEAKSTLPFSYCIFGLTGGKERLRARDV
jgi:hypothetical protein